MASEAVEGLLETTLLSKGILTKETIAGALERARAEGATLAKALVESEVLTEDDIAAIIAEACSVRPLKLEDVEIDREAVRHIPAAVAHRHNLVPVRRSGNTLVVAMADPSDKEAWAALRGVTDFEIVVFVSRMDAIEHALHIHYGEAPSESGAATGMGSMCGGEMVPDERFANLGRGMPLNRNLTFDSFVADTGSQYPLSLARTVVSGEPEERSCPLHFWGDSGCGKTHLLHAIANYLATREPLSKYLLTTGDGFADYLYDCLRQLKLNLFRYFYREAKYLLLDDCDSLLTKTWAQSELAETIVNVRGNGGWVVLTSWSDLMSEARLIPELRSALESGRLAGFEEYTPEGRARVLERQIGKINFPREAIQRLSNEFDGDMRHLQEMLRQFAAISVLESREVTEEAVEEMLTLYGTHSKPSAAIKKQRVDAAHMAAEGIRGRDDQ